VTTGPDEVDPTAMHVDAFIADAAASSEGKIYALGIGWNGIYTNAFPATHPHLAVVVTIHVPWTQTNEMHQVRLHLETEDGARVRLGQTVTEAGADPVDVLMVGGDFSVGRPPTLPAGDEQIVPLSFDIDGVTFTGPGMYTWVVSVDERQMRRLPMRVSLVPGAGAR